MHFERLSSAAPARKELLEDYLEIINLQGHDVTTPPANGGGTGAGVTSGGSNTGSSADSARANHKIVLERLHKKYLHKSKRETHVESVKVKDYRALFETLRMYVS
jgi:hypothetical protein